MTDTELRDELMTLLTAGHETTATGLAWAFERLLRTPRVLERLTASLDDDDYLDAVVKETLRVRPVIVDVARKLTREIEIAGWRLPAGTLVLPAIAVLHARPDLYDSPAEFRPERFVDGAAESYAWIPFGGGVRRCIGASFAQTEMRTVLREVLRRVRLRAPSQRPERGVIRHVTVVPGRGALAVVEGENQCSRGAARSQVGLSVEQPAELAGAHDGRAGVAGAAGQVAVRGHD
jgi:cytochrome P450 family 135